MTGHGCKGLHKFSASKYFNKVRCERCSLSLEAAQVIGEGECIDLDVIKERYGVERAVEIRDILGIPDSSEVYEEERTLKKMRAEGKISPILNYDSLSFSHCTPNGCYCCGGNKVSKGGQCLDCGVTR